MRRQSASVGIWLVIFALLVIGAVGGFAWQIYSQFNAIPQTSPAGEYVLTVDQGDTLEVVADQLSRDSVILNKDTFLLWEKLESVAALQAGEYKLAVPAHPSEVLKQIDTQARAKTKELAAAADRESKSITFKEGETLDQMITKLDQNGVVARAEMEAFAKDPRNFDRTRYPFLPEPLSCTYGDIFKCAKYYPEGYLYPDTYEFFTPSTPQEVFAKFLSNFSTKVWTQVREDLGDENLHQAMIMASVIEKESGRTRGVTAETAPLLKQERRLIAGVFYNRLQAGIQWASDPTLGYGQDLVICQRTFEIPGCAYLDDPRVLHLYNTYNNKGYPVGPIASPQLENILAALDPESSDYYYFVSDATGKKYFGRTEAEHDRNIANVNRINRELGL